jgi:hypothetical protein
MSLAHFPAGTATTSFGAGVLAAPVCAGTRGTGTTRARWAG